MKLSLSYILSIFPLLFFSQEISTSLRILEEQQLGPNYIDTREGRCAPIVQTSDGGYLLNYAYGGIGSFELKHSKLIKTNSNFNPLWTKRLDGWNGKRSFAFNDGSIILFSNESTEYTSMGSSNRASTFRLEKVNSLGQTLWFVKDNNSAYEYIKINDAVQINSNTIRFVGSKKINPNGLKGVILDFDLNGNLLQANTLFSNQTNEIQSICKSPTNDIFLMNIGRYTNQQYTHFKLNLSCIDSNNSEIWSKNINFNSTSYDPVGEYASSIILNNNDILFGKDISSGTKTKILLIRLTQSGTIVWAKTISSSNHLYLGDLLELSTNEIILTILSGDSTTKKNAIIKIDLNGNLIWSNEYAKTFSTSQLFQKNNDFYISAYGYDPYKFPLLININSQGNSNCSNVILPVTIEDIGISLVDVDLDITPITPSILTSSNPNTVQTVNYYNDLCIPLSIDKFESNNPIKLFPNPSSGLISVNSFNTINNILVYNVLGEIVNNLNINENDFSFNIEDKGIYFVRVITEEENKIFKIIIN